MHALNKMSLSDKSNDFSRRCDYASRLRRVCPKFLTVIRALLTASCLTACTTVDSERISTRVCTRPNHLLRPLFSFDQIDVTTATLICHKWRSRVVYIWDFSSLVGFRPPAPTCKRVSYWSPQEVARRQLPLTRRHRVGWSVSIMFNVNILGQEATIFRFDCKIIRQISVLNQTSIMHSLNFAPPWKAHVDHYSVSDISLQFSCSCNSDGCFLSFVLSQANNDTFITMTRFDHLWYKKWNLVDELQICTGPSSIHLSFPIQFDVMQV